MELGTQISFAGVLISPKLIHGEGGGDVVSRSKINKIESVVKKKKSQNGNFTVAMPHQIFPKRQDTLYPPKR